ncbi:Cell division cycle 7-related protein kinase [Frankliniella fusca]|uniref:Cell division cycle 7-related protein kinase n=1 Tax=Frankliniella fusca TaxID=407009 RepID=A0AAE1HBJ6_9NEOP|nr:Cell division cycle 7-related protein kinase [Frankliniella fusca]
MKATFLLIGQGISYPHTPLISSARTVVQLARSSAVRSSSPRSTVSSHSSGLAGLSTTPFTSAMDCFSTRAACSLLGLRGGVLGVFFGGQQGIRRRARLPGWWFGCLTAALPPRWSLAGGLQVMN